MMKQLKKELMEVVRKAVKERMPNARVVQVKDTMFHVFVEHHCLEFTVKERM